MKCWKSQRPFIGILKADKKVRKHLSASELKELFTLEPFLKHVDTLYKRVFG